MVGLGLDDDLDCAHIWGLAELLVTERGAEMGETCALCGAISYSPAAADNPSRERLL